MNKRMYGMAPGAQMRLDEISRGREKRGRKEPAPAVDGSTWEMRKRGSIGVISPLINCGYSAETLKSLEERGWKLYKDGKKVEK